MNRYSLPILVGALALVISACTAATETSTTTTVAETTTSADSTTSATAASETTSSVDGPGQWTIDDHLAWFLGLLNGGETMSDEYDARFAQVFRDQVAFDDFTPLTEQITAGLSGWEVIDTETRGSTNLVVLVAPSGGEPVLRVLMNVDSDGRIDGLFVQPGEIPTLDDPPETYDDAFERLAALGTTGALVAETTDGTCRPIAETLSPTPLPLGSMFKLYVLGAVADAVASGEIGWNDPVTLDESNYSLPSGITQTEEPGSERTVLILAQRMIEISDNTATDHLIALVGRDAVEATQAKMGTAEPSLNIPFLTTRELFQLKLGDAGLLAEYVNGDVDARRQVLDDLTSQPLPDLSAATGWTEPIEVLLVEWFASPLDLCEAWVVLAGWAAEPELEALADVVGANPGLPDETLVWDEIWFKGGSEPGVVGTSWYLVTDDGRSFVVAGSVANESESFDQTEAILLFGALRDLLAAEVSQ
ncbi:MAG: class A beta-lactamase-related serine hydrolase [Acidimicrobiia bacterium]|nr:class A beta-lactamase-related serine hydrolase [Acidimicrobiia bacterium]